MMMKKKSVVARRTVAAAVVAAGVVGGMASGAGAQLSAGADVVYTDCTEVTNWGTVGGVRGYSLGTYTCNIGDQSLRWGTTWSGTPAMAMNAYRVHDGRIEQIGMGWVKYSCCAAAGSGCGFNCSGPGGSLLGPGCRDIYGASYNGGQSRLGPRSQMNPSSGAITRVSGTSGNAIFKRLQIAEADMSAASFPGALYFVEGVTVASDDAPTLATGVNSYNNASSKQVTVGASFALTPVGGMRAGEPAITAWREHGNGLNTPDMAVELATADVPADGRFHVAAKAIDLGNGSWRYEYAVFNLNSHRSAGSFSVPVPSGATVSNAGFKDVNYHSGEPYDNTDWATTVGGEGVTWASPQTFDQNANSNALRWGTMYNFWFEADVAPGAGEASIGLFRPVASGPDSVPVAISVPGGGGGCPVDWNGDELVNSSDISAYLTAWLASVTAPDLVADFNGDEVTNSSDISAFLTAWLEGVVNGC